MDKLSRMCEWPFIKPASHCQILKSLMTFVLTNVIGCDSCLLRSHLIFRSHCPTDRIQFFLCSTHNAFRAMIEMNNRMRFIQSSLTCQSSSDSIRFFKITSDHPIVPDFASDFPSDPSNHQIIWQWDANLNNLYETATSLFTVMYMYSYLTNQNVFKNSKN